MFKDTDYENGYFTSYDLVDTILGIPGVSSKDKCKSICELTSETNGCSHYTWQEHGECYLVDNPSSLEYDSDKISGARNCIYQAVDYDTEEYCGIPHQELEIKDYSGIQKHCVHSLIVYT